MDNFNNTDLQIGGSFRYNYLYNIICKKDTITNLTYNV